MIQQLGEYGGPIHPHDRRRRHHRDVERRRVWSTERTWRGTILRSSVRAKAAFRLPSISRKRGKRVVLFERGELGGCCVNVGCTPSKAFLASAHAAGRARRARGRSACTATCASTCRPSWRACARIVGEWRDGVEQKLARSAVELVRAEAAFDAPHVLLARRRDATKPTSSSSTPGASAARAADRRARRHAVSHQRELLSHRDAAENS